MNSNAQPPFNVYQPGENGDVGLLNWYAQLVANGDLQKLLGSSLWPLSSFIRHFTEPNAVLYYKADDQGWWAVACSFPFMGGGTWSLWVRDDKRLTGSREGIEFIVGSLDSALQLYPILVNVTKQDAVVEKTTRLGYAYLGQIPLLFDGNNCHVLYLTREMFEPLLSKWSTYDGRRKNRCA